MTAMPTPDQAPAPWWREPEVAFLFLLVVAAYLVRLGDGSMRAEEPRWTQVAAEIRQSGDWVVPREQGEPFLSRPPLHSWLIACSTLFFGSRDAWAVRFPSLLGMLGGTLLVYGYSRLSLSRLGALAAAVAFATFGEMFTTGCQAETEAVFIPLVSASLLLWHWGQLRNWPVLVTWVVSYACVGLAMLAKGPQAPVYFLTSVVAYLLWTRQWRRLFGPAHLAGMVVCAAIVLGWAIPCGARAGWPPVVEIFMSDASARFRDWKTLAVGAHLLRFPVEVLGSTLPWSLLLFCYLSRDLRRSLGEARPQILFAALCLAIAFVTCWIPPGGQTRYLAPLYPCLAVLIGLVVQRGAAVAAPSRVRAGWWRFATLVAAAMTGAAAVVVLAAFLLANHAKYAIWAESPPVALGYAAVVGALAVLTFKGRHGGDEARVRTVVLATACFMVLTFTGLLMNVRIRRSVDQATEVARLKEHLPEGCRLVSYGHTDALFAYYYGRPIDAQAVPAGGNDPPTDAVYFCVNAYGTARPSLPFAWEEVGVVCMDRNRSDAPERFVVVGRTGKGSR